MLIEIRRFFFDGASDDVRLMATSSGENEDSDGDEEDEPGDRGRMG